MKFLTDIAYTVVRQVTRFLPSVDILEIQKRVHLIPYLQCMRYKRTLVLEIDGMIFVYLIIIIIIRLNIAINVLQRNVKQYSMNRSVIRQEEADAGFMSNVVTDILDLKISSVFHSEFFQQLAYSPTLSLITLVQRTTYAKCHIEHNSRNITSTDQLHWLGDEHLRSLAPPHIIGVRS